MAITVPVISQFNSKGIDQAKREFAKLETPAQKAGFAINKGFVPALAVLGGLGAAGANFARVAMEDQQSVERLSGTLRRNTDITEEGLHAVERMISAMEMQHAVADGDLRNSLGRLVTVTGDVAEAQDLMTMALDIAAATGKPLETVTEGLARAYGGNLSALERLDPSLRDIIKESESLNDVQGHLIETFGGASEEMANTAAGRLKRMELATDNARKAIGYMVLPIVERLAPALQRLAEFVQDNSRVLGIMAAVVGTVAAAIVALNIVMKVVTVVTKAATVAAKLFNLVMKMNPIGLVVLAIMALIAIFIVLQRRFDIVGKAMEFLGGIFTTVKDGVLTAWNAVLSWFRKLPGIFTGIGRTLINVLTYPWRTAFNMISKLWNSTIGSFSISIPNWVPVIGGRSFGFPQMPTIPALAEGGIVTRPTLALIGEAGPEAVIPLNRAGAMGGGVTVNVAGSVVSERDLVESVRVGLLQSQRDGRQVA